MTIQFRATIDHEQVIRPPAGVVLPVGEIEVTVSPPSQQSDDEEAVRQTREMLLAFAAEAEREGSQLPSDLAEHHDYYARGKPREE